MDAEIVETTIVRQRIEGEEWISLRKEVILLPGPIALERKHLPSGPTLPPVILVHGFAQNRYTWDCSQRSMSNFLAAQGFDVWNMELRGHGRSRDANSKGAESVDDYLQDLILVANFIEQPAFWIGHSLGGATIYRTACTMLPLKCLGIIGIGAIYHFGNNPVIRVLCHLTNRLVRASFLSDLQIKTRLGGDLLAKLYGISDVVGYTFPLSGWWPGTVEPDLLRERMKRGMDWTSVEVWKEMSRWGTQEHFDYHQTWKQLDIPLLVILGDKDHLLTPRDGRPAFDESGSTDKEILLLDDFHHETHWGHLDIILGKHASKYVWEPISSWMKKRRSIALR
ncbi:MAG: alpha/beta fold hydrolase [Myxococcota bacterium]|nr:alpha/beta fold hydrolase [Myxococcota bacterium]